MVLVLVAKTPESGVVVLEWNPGVEDVEWE